MAADLLGVEIKTASRLLSKAEKIGVLSSEGKQRIRCIGKNKYIFENYHL